MPDELLNQANRDFEISPGFSKDIASRMDQGFQRVTIVPGLRFTDAGPTTAPGGIPEQTGPSPLVTGFGGSGGEIGNSAPSIYNLLNQIVQTGPEPTLGHPESGGEQVERHSCLSGKCVPDPNGIYGSIEECLESGCGSESGGGLGGDGNGCDCGCGPSQTVLKAEITGITCAAGGLLFGSRTYWTYSWIEVFGAGRTNVAYGDALNEYERSVEDDGGNQPPPGTVLERLRIPTGSIVKLILDLDCVPWFETPNPLRTTCE